MNALKAQPWIHDNLIAVMSHFLSIVHTMHHRCSSSVEVNKLSLKFQLSDLFVWKIHSDLLKWLCAVCTGLSLNVKI